jgi:hypothetical protein
MCTAVWENYMLPLDIDLIMMNKCVLHNSSFHAEPPTKCFYNRKDAL